MFLGVVLYMVYLSCFVFLQTFSQILPALCHEFFIFISDLEMLLYSFPRNKGVRSIFHDPVFLARNVLSHPAGLSECFRQYYGYLLRCKIVLEMRDCNFV